MSDRWVRRVGSHEDISGDRSSYLVNFRNRPIKHLTNNHERYSYLVLVFGITLLLTPTQK